jgi:hypothetical protein
VAQRSAVTEVEERGGPLEAEVELAIAATVCTHCARAGLEVKGQTLATGR